MTKRLNTPTIMLFVLCGLMAVCAVYFLYLISSKSLQNRGEFAAELTYYSAQADYEILQLIDHLDRFTAEDPEVSHDDVVSRFDIVWSRAVNTEFQTGRGVSYVSLPGAARAIENLQQTLREIEPEVMSLAPGNRSSSDALRQRLRGNLIEIHAVSLEALISDAWNDEVTMQAQIKRSYASIALVIGLLFTGTWLFIRGLLDRQALADLNRTLEDRVQVRTQQLETTNAALNEEIAERERSQIRASARATRLIQAAQLSKLGYYVRDVGNGRCIYCSAQHASSYGLSQADYIEKACAIDDQVAMIHPDDREAVRASYEKLRSGEQIEIEYRVETERGTRRIREAACPILDVEGRIVQEIGSTVDFTEQYETEMKLFESQRLDSIGKMTGGVAHDFNNLLSVILGNLELIRAMDRNPERRELTDDAISASRRASDLVRNMLSFARRAPLKPTEFNLNEVIGAMQDLLHRALPETIKLETQLSLDLPPVHADKSSTESALLNLILNARDALPRGGTITIETSHVTMTAGQTDLTPGDYAQLSVRDTGSGIDPELLPKIFEPFVSSKDPSSNSGLGLSMVHGFMQQSEGGVRVSTGAESGTAIDLFFPARPALLVAANGVAAEPQEAKIGARILLVEDEPQVRKTVRMHLDRAGMNVAEAANGTEAQKIFEASGPFDLLLTDMVMPGEIQGTQLAANLRERAPELRVIFLSGYSHEADAGDPVAINDTYLMKPTPRDALLGAISKALA